MPAYIAHDCFAHDVMSAHPGVCGDSRDEVQAFLLGSQGPDPLFFLPGPPPAGTKDLAKRMHSEAPAPLLAMLARSLEPLEGPMREIARAYAHGFLMHYLLDSSVHPLVYAQVEAVCSAGVEGLDAQDKGIVHTYIEREYDQMVLFVKRGMTVRDFKPTDTILAASPAVAMAAQQVYAYLAVTLYGQQIPANAFVSALLAYRTLKRLIWSPRGVKNALAGQVETLFRRHSFARTFGLQPVELESTWLANPDHLAWEHQATGEMLTASFWDLYNSALDRAWRAVELFDAPGFDEEAARAICGDINFRGEPTVATLTVVGEG